MSCVLPPTVAITITPSSHGRSLDVRVNYLSGPIPPVVTSLTTLTALLLCCNSFSGSIPPTISALTRLVLLDVSASNGGGLSGTLPSTLASLTSLQ